MRKPYFRKDRGCWFVKINDGKSQVNLGSDEEAAYDKWRELQESSAIRSNAPCATVLQEFLLHAQQHYQKPAFDNFTYYVIDFVNKFGKVPLSGLKPAHITKWLAGRDWSSSTTRTAIARVKRAFNWAVDEGYIPTNPFARVKRPAEARRTRLITDDEHARMMTAGNKRHRYSKRVAAFRAVLIAMRHSGARPSSVAKVTAEHVTPGTDAWVFDKHKTAGQTGRPLVVYLSPCLQTLTKIAMHNRQSGPLFRNAKGEPWKANAIRCRMRRLRESLKLDPGAVAYAYRHTFVTNSLLAGVDMATVAELVGHRSLEMIARHYSHLSQATDHLRQAAAKSVKSSRQVNEGSRNRQV